MTLPAPPLSPSIAARLDGALRNETDIAFKRRIPLILRYLDARPTDRILDCGCGMGFLLRTLASLYPANLLGIELRAPTLARAQQELADYSVDLLRASVLELPLRAESVDKAMMTEVLEHLPDDVAGLREVYRVLRPGGRVVVTVPNHDYPFWWDPINKSLERTLGTHVSKDVWWLAGIWADHVRLYTAAQLHQSLTAAGFVVEEITPYTHFCVPFHHLLVYGLGKNLLERKLLPRRLARAADRFRGEENDSSALNPINLGVRILHAIDRRNDDLQDPALTYVGLAAWARKPDPAASAQTSQEPG